MPTQIANDSTNSGSGHDVKVKLAYNGEVMITYIDESITYEELVREIREICRFSGDQVNHKRIYSKICQSLVVNHFYRFRSLR